ncbi:hypothetical protein P7C71_g3053, partial [Lecanoromycetidae sp. Uapishka_2]
MIERVARCLETGGRVCLRGSKQPFRSRRCLHNAFWSHGAANIDLPSWWILLLQTSDHKEGSRARTRINDVGKKVSGALQDIFLDFLYPVQTLAFIRRLKRSTAAHHNAASTVRTAASSVKQYSRNYTSFAEAVITGEKTAHGEAQEEVETAYADPSVAAPRSVDMIRRRIDEIFDAKDQTRLYDELWRNYQDLVEASQSLSQPEVIKMLRSLGKSKRPKDLERCVAFFESLPVPERRAIHYSHAVSAALALNDLNTALLIHQEARSRISGSIGTSAILGHTIQHELWHRAVGIWHQYWVVGKMAYFASADIWTTVDTLSLPVLIDRALSAANFAVSLSGNAECEAQDGAGAARDFALELARRSCRRKGATFDVEKHWALLQKVKMLDASDIEISVMALNQLLSIVNREHGHRALHLYRILRKETAFTPSRELLSTITEMLLVQKSTLGMFMVVDDWQNYFKTLPAHIALKIANVLAQNGQLEATEKLFDKFCKEHGTPKSDSLYHSLLYVYNRRADVNGITRMLNRLGEDYGFKPGLRAYNYVISTFARIGDVHGAMSWYKKLEKKGIKPDRRTFSTLMVMFGTKGDRDALNEIFQLSKVEGIIANATMIDTLIQINIRDEDFEEAERLVKEASRTDLEGSHTFMWNILLNAHALRKNVEKVSELHGQMQQAGVAPDNMTYAALMTSLTVAKHPKAANKILQRVMPRANMKRTALHYAIVIGGFLATKEYGEIFRLYKDMIRRNLSPTMSTQNVLLRAAASIDMSNKSPKTIAGGPTELLRAQQTLEQTLATLDPMELAASEPRKFVGPSPVNEAFSATYFEYLIFLYGKDAAFDKVTELYERFMKTTSQFTHQDIEASPPMRLLSALMVAHRRGGNYEDIEKCWNLALDQCKELARRSKATFSKPGWVLHSRRFIISLPLRQYMKSLGEETPVPAHKINQLNATIAYLQECGYELNSPNWNLYIQILSQSVLPDHQVLAFEECERELINHWPGWGYLGNPEYMKTKLSAMTRSTLLMPQQRMPAYLTFVRLAKAYVQARNRRTSATTNYIRHVAPRTVDAVNNMPRVEDRPQKTILRPDQT